MKSRTQDNNPDNLAPINNVSSTESSGQECEDNFKSSNPVEHVTDIHCPLLEIIAQTELLTEQCPELERFSSNDDANRKSALYLALEESVEEPPTLTPMIKGAPESVDHMPIRKTVFQRTTEASTLEKLMQARLKNWRFFNGKNKREFVRKHVLGIWMPLPMKPRELCRYSKILAKELENANLLDSAADAVSFMSPIQQVLVLDILQDIPQTTSNADKNKKTVDQQKLLKKKTKSSIKNRKKQTETAMSKTSSAIYSAACDAPRSQDESLDYEQESLNLDNMLSLENLTKHALEVPQNIPHEIEPLKQFGITELQDIASSEISAMTNTSSGSQSSKETVDGAQGYQNTTSLASLKNLEEQTTTVPQHITSSDTTATNVSSASTPPNHTAKSTRVRDNVKPHPKPYTGFRALKKAAAKGLPKLKMPRFPPAPKSLTEQERMILQNLGMTDSQPPAQQLEHDVTMWRTAYGQHMSTSQGNMPNNTDHMIHPLAPASEWITTTDNYYHLKQPPRPMQMGGSRPQNQAGVNQARSIQCDPQFYSQPHCDYYKGPTFPPRYINNNYQNTGQSSNYPPQYTDNRYDNRQNQTGYNHSDYRNGVYEYSTRPLMNSNPGPSSMLPPNNNNDNQPK